MTHHDVINPVQTYYSVFSMDTDSPEVRDTSDSQTPDKVCVLQDFCTNSARVNKHLSGDVWRVTSWK